MGPLAGQMNALCCRTSATKRLVAMGCEYAPGDVPVLLGPMALDSTTGPSAEWVVDDRLTVRGSVWDQPDSCKPITMTEIARTPTAARTFIPKGNTRHAAANPHQRSPYTRIESLS